MSNAANGDGSCGFRVVWQASQCAFVPILDRVGAAVDISYGDNFERLERIRWAEGRVEDLPPHANQARLHTYIQWLCKPAKLESIRQVPSVGAVLDVD